MKYRIAWCILVLLPLLAGCGGSSPRDRAEIAYLVSDDAGNTYVAWRLARSVGDHDVYLTKISPTGEVFWDKALFIGDTRRVAITGMVNDNRGGVYVGWDVLVPENGKEGRHNFTLCTLVNVDAQGNVIMSRDFSSPGMQMRPDGHGGVLLCRYAREDSGIERVDASGATLWGYDLEINEGYRQFIAGDGGESVLLTRNQGDTYITVRKIGPDGQAGWGPEGIKVDIPPSDMYTEQNPLMINDSAGGIIVCWATWVSDEMTSNIGAFRLGAGGELVYDESLCVLGSITTGHVKSCSDGPGVSVIVWEDHRSGFGLYAQKINEEGEPLWQENGVAVCTGLPEYSPRFEALSGGSGGVIVVWRDGRSGLRAQRLDSSGRPQWGDGGIQIADDACDSPILISGDGRHGITIGWSAGKDEYSHEKSFVQMISSEGELLWGANGIEI